MVSSALQMSPQRRIQLSGKQLVVGSAQFANTPIYLAGYIDQLNFTAAAATSAQVQASYYQQFPQATARWMLDATSPTLSRNDIVGINPLVLDSGQLAPTPHGLAITSTVSGTINAGNAMVFPGWNGSTGSTLRTTNQVDLDGGFTISLWAKRDRSSNDNDYMVSTEFWYRHRKSRQHERGLCGLYE
jgi:hypothetical protein